MSFYQHKDREEKASSTMMKMGKALSELWLKGDHNGVKNTIDCALSYEMRNQWKDAIADKLPAGEREKFLNFTRV